MIDIDLKDFASKDMLDRAMNRILKKIESKIHGHPWTYGLLKLISAGAQRLAELECLDRHIHVYLFIGRNILNCN